MEVRAGCPASLANMTDGLPLSDAFAFANALAEAGEVCIQGSVLVIVSQDDYISVTSLGSDKIDSGVCGCSYRGAGRGCIVHPLVGTPGVQDGVEASAEAGADAGKLKRGAEKGFLQRFAIRCQIASLVVALVVPEGAVNLACIDELCGDDAPASRWLPFLVAHLIGDGEAVAFAQVGMEINFAAEDFSELDGNGVRNAGGVGGAKERIFDLRALAGYVDFRTICNYQGLKLISGSFNGEYGFLTVEREVQLHETAVTGGAGRNFSASDELLSDCCSVGGVAQKIDSFAVFDIQARKQAL